ncbi:YsnF/AvaK domain-containing protein [Pontibacter actiniarum]|uniref:DUF2382 domain-containing protein n=1 Tax=Pontibacter actiniarum TaxID=323450 RepID=A0A1X9YPQ8_9BACT|nr:YsnF/AvaK domain-containing protein [Pontibacter actiniarum]ARS34811.1 hypothetical protein CA264_04785 [Pontibacter actiniarum]
MNNRKDKVQKSEFEQKLEESQAASLQNHHPEPETRSATETIPVVEEELRVGKKEVETGRVRISKDVHEEQVEVDVPLTHEEIDVVRVAINQHVDTPPPPVRYEGDKMIIPVLKEEVVVQKRLVLVEELHVTRKQVQTHEKQQVTLRKEEVNVDRVNSRHSNEDQA